MEEEEEEEEGMAPWDDFDDKENTSVPPGVVGAGSPHMVYNRQPQPQPRYPARGGGGSSSFAAYSQLPFDDDDKENAGCSSSTKAGMSARVRSASGAAGASALAPAAMQPPPLGVSRVSSLAHNAAQASGAEDQGKQGGVHMSRLPPVPCTLGLARRPPSSSTQLDDPTPHLQAARSLPARQEQCRHQGLVLAATQLQPQLQPQASRPIDIRRQGGSGSAGSGSSVVIGSPDGNPPRPPGFHIISRFGSSGPAVPSTCEPEASDDEAEEEGGSLPPYSMPSPLLSPQPEEARPYRHATAAADGPAASALQAHPLNGFAMQVGGCVSVGRGQVGRGQSGGGGGVDVPQVWMWVGGWVGRRDHHV